MSDSTCSATSERGKGLRSPFRFPANYNLTNTEISDFETLPHGYACVSFATPAAVYTGLPNGGLFGDVGDTYRDVGASDLDFSLGNLASLGSISEYSFDCKDNKETTLDLSTNGELHLYSPALALNQNSIFDHMPTPLGFCSHKPLIATSRTLADTAPSHTSSNTSTPQSPQDVGWLLAEPLPNLAHHDTTKDQAVSRGSTPSSTPEPITPADSISASANARHCFNNYEEFSYARSRVAWKAPANDGSIPKTPAQMGAVVDKLIAAIRNNVGCLGKITRSFVNRWSTGASFYDHEDIEIVAWEIMLAMINIHTKGWNKHIGDRSLRESLRKTRDWTFTDRLGEVIELLKVSKRTCEDLLKGDDPHAIIGVPEMLLKRTKSNESSNKRKGERIRRASDLEKQDEAFAEAKSTQQSRKRMREEEHDATPGTPVKRAKMKVKMNKRASRAGNI